MKLPAVQRLLHEHGSNTGQSEADDGAVEEMVCGLDLDPLINLVPVPPLFLCPLTEAEIVYVPTIFPTLFAP